jgi:hypothetical protein
VFVHYSAIQISGYRTLEEGQRVEFDVGLRKKGEEAQNVRVMDHPPAERPSESQHQSGARGASHCSYRARTMQASA